MLPRVYLASASFAVALPKEFLQMYLFSATDPPPTRSNPPRGIPPLTQKKPTTPKGRRLPC
uniref:Uncharacterized protein n=1 Tax=uncultured marine virus TaxID=186617 RepID=A0A0F7L2X8_9VIRU|nr:hypothetical protein [uncultured marine virus]